ncbi:unnamed protein product, partial [Rotaria sp. Silwood1]
GRTFNQAVSIIRSQNPRLQVIPLLEGSSVTYDLQQNHVLVFYNRMSLISSVPAVG